MAESLGDNQKRILEEAVQQFVDAQLDGQELIVDEFIKQYPDLEEHLRQRIDNLQEIDDLFSSIMGAEETELNDSIAGHELIGQKLGDFEILRLIGTGGMGAVFLAHQLSLDREVALKVISDISGACGKTLERFAREAKVLAKISHSNIVPIFEVGQEGPYSYFAMEYVQGVSLDKILNSIRHANTEEKASDILRRCLETQSSVHDGIPEQEGDLQRGADIDTDYIVQMSKVIISIASALEYAHSQGVLHRDVKPSNILVGKEDKATLTDFGIVKAMGESGLTTTGTSMGTPEYMAPEQITGEEPDSRMDLYALGVVAFHILTGRVPFTGTTPYAIQKGHTEEPPPDPKEINPALGDHITEAVLKAMSKKTDDRFQFGGKFSEALAAR